MRHWLITLAFLAGLALGVSGTILAPRLAGPYLPASIRGKTEVIDGEVARKLREQDRLLLTVLTRQGAILATFKKRVTEIDLLIDEGDTLTLALTRYAPFVEDPVLERVRKRAAGPEDPAPPATERQTLPR